MAYRVEVGSKASAQLSELDATVGSAVERKIIWLVQNADTMIHGRLVGMPDDLARLCKLRAGDWRIITGSITRKKLSVSMEFSTDPKYIVSSNKPRQCTPVRGS
jgi:mRNA-degrading endonuclease RelE of RelBE toxin-antitoxin system